MSDKFSLVVPTMWRYPPFISFLYALVDIDAIGEIIIINNMMESRPNDAILHNPKIKIHDFHLNIFVNPAWNYGVGVSNYENICIMNDDIEFDLGIFDFLSTRLFSGGLIVYAQSHSGFRPDCHGQLSLEKIHDDSSINEIGTLMFMKRKDWTNIPAGLDFFHGDTWIWRTMQAKYNENYIIRNLRYYTPHRVTSAIIPNREFIYIERECKIFESLFTNFKNSLD